MSTVADHLPQYSHDFDGASNLQLLNADLPTFGDIQAFYVRFKRDGTGVEEFIFSKGVGAANGFFLEITAGNLLHFQTVVNVAVPPLSSPFTDIFISTTTVNDTNWHDVFVLTDTDDATASNHIIMYIDGTLETASTYTTSRGPHIVNTGRFRWGSNSAETLYFSGLMYNLGTASGKRVYTDSRESDGTARDIKSTSSLQMHLNIDAGEVETDWLLVNWINSGVTASTTLGDASTP